MFTRAPMPMAIFAALMPTTPPPMIETPPRRDAGHAAEEDAAAAVVLLEELRAELHRHLAGDLAHRGEQGQGAVARLDRLVGDA